MPPKDTNSIQALYYIGPDGLKAKIENICDVNLGCCDEPDGIALINDTSTLTLTLQSPAFLNVVLRSLLFGIPIPNNWLKMHGFPMRRKCRKRRC